MEAGLYRLRCSTPLSSFSWTFHYLFNKANGIAYHYDGQLVSDSDKARSEEEMIEIIKHGHLKKDIDLIDHYDSLIIENNDPVNDPEPLRAYMDKWDGKAFINELQSSPTKSVLEIGVGTGRLAVKVAPLCGRFTGIDISPKTIERAKENLAEYKNTELICDDFLTHSFDEKFDTIYSSLTFMHIKEKSAAINKIAGLLKTGGRFVLSIDKNQSEYIEMNNRKVEIYPDNPDEIFGYIKDARLVLEKQIETGLAFVFTTRKV